MFFEYTSAIYIDEEDLMEMVMRVKAGEIFDDVFYDILAGYEDVDYYHCELIIDEVHKEVARRLG